MGNLDALKEYAKPEEQNNSFIGKIVDVDIRDAQSQFAKEGDMEAVLSLMVKVGEDVTFWERSIKLSKHPSSKWQKFLNFLQEVFPDVPRENLIEAAIGTPMEWEFYEEKFTDRNGEERTMRMLRPKRVLQPHEVPVELQVDGSAATTQATAPKGNDIDLVTIAAIANGRKWEEALPQILAIPAIASNPQAVSTVVDPQFPHVLVEKGVMVMDDNGVMHLRK